MPANIKRGDPRGAPINWEITTAPLSNAAIVRVETRFLGDGQPPVVQGFPEPWGHAAGDWNFNKGTFVRPMVVGLFPVEVRVTDANGCVGVGQSATLVRVFQ